MHWATLGTFVVLEIALCFIPGPAVLSVVGATLGGRARSGLATAGGILTGNAIYFVVSALGVASAIVASHAAFLAIKWSGAAYLAYLGICAVMTKAADLEGAPPVSAGGVVTRGWVKGTIVQLSNPKALIFFTAILPQFVDPHGDLLLQITILGVAGLVVELCVLATYVAAAERIGRYGFDGRRRLWAERIGGAYLVGVAAAVARAS